MFLLRRKRDRMMVRNINERIMMVLDLASCAVYLRNTRCCVFDYGHVKVQMVMVD